MYYRDWGTPHLLSLRVKNSNNKQQTIHLDHLTSPIEHTNEKIEIPHVLALTYPCLSSLTSPFNLPGSHYFTMVCSKITVTVAVLFEFTVLRTDYM